MSRRDDRPDGLAAARSVHAHVIEVDRGVDVDAVWPLEVSNGLRFAAGSGRVDLASIARASQIVLQLPVEIRPVEVSTAITLLEDAGRLSLTVYDAVYLDLARVLGLGVATLDERLAAACRTVGVPLVE